ncbi:MAG: Omp28-related outer membrane protein [Bacteroidia bacterium]|nr:Omp28-related outer membrane protein [Bacteroidia bacterium]MDW8159269.1 Omp28-related outer membrane protein [Bacteroidia bacterium]
MKKVFLFTCALFFSPWLFSQNYFYKIVRGSEAALQVFPENPKVILSGPTNNQPAGVVSQKQTLPFTWKFYGEDVTEYWVSDKGYLTFVEPGAANAQNIALPNANAPKSAIFAFWDDLSFFTAWPDIPSNPNAPRRNGGIVSYTYGSAPNRTHVIQWVRAVSGGEYFRVFAILLRENGDFDIVHSWGGSSNKANATIGVQNSDATKGVQVYGSPNLNLPALELDNADDIVFKFTYGQQPERDIEALAHNLPDILQRNTKNLQGAQFMIRNYGSQTIESMDIYLQMNNETPQKLPLTAIKIDPYATYIANISNFDYTRSTPGEVVNIKIWIGSVNNGSLVNLENDTLYHRLRVIQGITTSRNVFLEEFTGTWCPNCPRGHRIFDLIVKSNPRAMIAAHHGPDAQSDVMFIPESGPIIQAYRPSYPNLAVDRIFWPDKGSVAFFDPGDNSWSTKTTQRLNMPTPMEVKLTNVQYNPSNRNVSVTLEAKLLDYVKLGSLRFNIYVTEDSVVGPSPSYDQRDGQNTIRGYVHRHVLRAAPTGAWGDATVIPENYELNKTYSKTYEFRLPDGVRPHKVSLLGFVMLFDQNITRHEVFNAHEVTLVPTSIEEQTSQKHFTNFIQEVYPNPSKGLGFIKLGFTTPTEASVVVYNSLGQKVATLVERIFLPGEHTVYFDTENVAPGVYTIVVESANGKDSHKIVVN